ncbi:hypothetical protein AsAng_0031770 [Aureispira anguillae]|uniref:Macrodomain effector MavL domain-containing protein n=1 Tax=Aureispira anguillae TaxID=2864201 RepID=A0A915YG86_9BACT|nr:hypothetical protein [Aureispira anguillae]BDS12454.1 hypothetical protein AsAng_0031770 [Aureispira anguillae]
MKKYQVLVPKVTFERTATYLRNLKNKSQRTGFYLYKALKNKNIQTLETEDLLELLMQTKQPQIFAESAVKGDGSDWNLMELSILGDCKCFYF